MHYRPSSPRRQASSRSALKTDRHPLSHLGHSRGPVLGRRFSQPKPPVAMAPLALVWFGRGRPGGHALGGALAAAYVAGEVLGAGFLIGPRLATAHVRGQLIAGLASGAIAFTGLGMLDHAHPWILAALALVAGAAPSAAPGGLRALLIAQLPEGLAVKAISVESVLNYVSVGDRPGTHRRSHLPGDGCLENRHRRISIDSRSRAAVDGAEYGPETPSDEIPCVTVLVRLHIRRSPVT